MALELQVHFCSNFNTNSYVNLYKNGSGAPIVFLHQLHYKFMCTYISFNATGLEANPLEPARAKCTLKLQGHRARSQSVRARSSHLHFEASGPLVLNHKEANPLEPARAKCTVRIQGHRARSQSARARSSQMHFEASRTIGSKPQKRVEGGSQ
jgi:hypothetical protein